MSGRGYGGDMVGGAASSAAAAAAASAAASRGGGRVIHNLGRSSRERVVRRWPTSARYKVSGRGYGGNIRSRGGRASVRGCAFGALRVGVGEREGEGVWQ